MAEQWEYCYDPETNTSILVSGVKYALNVRMPEKGEIPVLTFDISPRLVAESLKTPRPQMWLARELLRRYLNDQQFERHITNDEIFGLLLDIYKRLDRMNGALRDLGARVESSRGKL
jgi:hypothetical protein